MLDTLRYSKQLQSAGVSQAQADAQAEALRDAVIESVATKAQVDGLAAALRSDLAVVEQRLDAKIDGVEQRLIAEMKQLRWIGGVVVAFNIAILAKLLLA